MHIFLTGATGYVGSHVLEHLLAFGHQVTALTRRTGSQPRKGLTWLEGSLEQPHTYRAALSQADAIVHLGMEYKDGTDKGDIDRIAIEAFVGSGTPILYTGNLYTSLQPGSLLDETLPPVGHHWWNDHERLVLDAPQVCAVLRLGFVYGGSGGYLWPAFKPSDDGALLQCGDPDNRWPFVHVEDVCTLISLILEQQAVGVFHAYDGNTVSLSELFQQVTTLQGGTVRKASTEEACEKLGSFASYMLLDFQVSNARACALGWQPAHPCFLGASAEAYQHYTQHQEKECA